MFPSFWPLLTSVAAHRFPLLATGLKIGVHFSGWKYARSESNWAIFTSGDGADRVTIEVPQLTQAKDYGRVFQGVIEELARIEARPVNLVLGDIRSSTRDVVRLIFDGSALNDGRIPLNAGASTYQAARSLLMAAACSAVEPRLDFGLQEPELARQLIERARLRPSEQDAFVVSIETPIAPLLQPESHPDDSDEPIDRRAWVLLARGVAAVKEATQRTEVSVLTEFLSNMVIDGVSANLCDALAALLEGSNADRMTIEVAFAASRPMNSRIPFSTAFTANQARLLRELGRTLRRSLKSEIRGVR